MGVNGEIKIESKMLDSASNISGDPPEIKVEPPRIEIISNQAEIMRTFLDLVNSAAREILIVFPTQAAFQREEIIGVNEALDRASKERGVNVRLLVPLNYYVKNKIEEREWILSSEADARDSKFQAPAVIAREIEVTTSETKITFCTFDGEKALAIELRDNSKLQFEKAIGFATYSTSKPTVSTYVAFFEKLWRENKLRESETLARRELVSSLAREEKATRQAKLLQDIIAHDIVNYNQIIKLHIELLGDLPEFKANPELQHALSVMNTAIEGSTNLLEKARKLGRVLSDQGVKLSPKSLVDSIGGSLSLVVKANPSKKITNQVSFPAVQIEVLADDFIDEIFTNLYSNSVKYTDSKDVILQTFVQDAGDSWSVRVVDHGRGIPPEAKTRVFERYSGGIKGSGLGMSIVRALVIDRYGGSIRIKDTIEGDYTKGTIVEMSLPKSTAMEC
jgi:signal transduction histidine kinase